MKQFKVSDVHYQMAQELSRKRRMRVDEYMEELIQKDYNGKKEMKVTPQNLNIRIKPGEVVAVRALDDPNYYRTILIKPNPYTSGFQ